MDNVRFAFREVIKNIDRRFIFTLKGKCMFPTLEEGDKLEVTTKIDDLKIGDILLFKFKDSILAHRLYRVDFPEKDYIQTKADSYLFPDEPVPLSKVIGKVISVKSRHFNIDKDMSYVNIVQKAIDLSETSFSHKVLDVGTGAGVMSINLALNNCKVTTIDHCAESISVAKDNAKKLDVFEKIDYNNVNFEDYWCNSKFDRIFAYHTFHHLQQPREVLEKMIKLCHERGKIIIIEFQDYYLKILHNFTSILENNGKISKGNHPESLITTKDIVDYLTNKNYHLDKYELRNDLIIVANSRS